MVFKGAAKHNYVIPIDEALHEGQPRQDALYQAENSGMKVIRHAGVDSRMIILDDQAGQLMTRHF